MSLRDRASSWLRSNVVVRALNEALDGNLIGEYALTALFGAALIVCWSFALVRSNALLRGPSEGRQAHNLAAGRSTRPPAPNLTKLNVRASDAVRYLGETAPDRSPRTASQHNTVRPASDPHRAVDETLRRDGDSAHCLPASTRGKGSHARPASSRPAVRSSSGGNQWAGSVQSGPEDLRAIVRDSAKAECVPQHILAGLAEDESGWRATVVGKHGEVGLLQLKSAVATWCGIQDRRNPRQNARCGARYLALQFERFGTWELALVAFKAGPEAIPDSIPASSWAYAQRALLKAEAYR